MDHRGALIFIPEPVRGAGAVTCAARFGEESLLARTVRIVRGVAAHVAVAQAAGAAHVPDLPSFPDGVWVAPPSAAGAGRGETVRMALDSLPPAVSEVLLAPADLPYLDEAWVSRMFDALGPENDEVCLVEGERRLPLPAAVRRAAMNGAEMAALLDGAEQPARTARRAFLPLEPVGRGGASVATRMDSMEGYRRALVHHGFCDSSQASITLELYGNLRIKTGCEHLPIHAATVLGALEVLRRVYPEAERLLPEDASVAEHFRFSINGGEVTTALHHSLVEGDHLILFSATVGG